MPKSYSDKEREYIIKDLKKKQDCVWSNMVLENYC